MRWLFLLLLASASCQYRDSADNLVIIQVQDRNGVTETISAPERLEVYTNSDFLSSQPYKKVLRVYKREGKNHSKITTYHPNGLIWQYLEAQEMRAHGAYKEWYPSGILRLEARVIGGTADVTPGSQNDWLFDGVSQVWDEKGNLIAKIPYNQGVLEGISIHYFSNSQIEKRLPYIQNFLHGTALEYFPNGQIRTQTSYERGAKQGSNVGFFDNGRQAFIEEYRDDLLVQGIYYDIDGNLISEVIDGHGAQALFNDNFISFLIQIKQGFKEGGVKQFNAQGEMLSQYSIKNGKKQGEEILYYLKKDLPEVIEKSNRNDLLAKISIQWVEDQIHGSVKTWYNSGQLQSQREYAKNKKMGTSLAWYRDGSLMLIEEYEGNKLIKGQYFKKNSNGPVSTVINGNGTAILFDEEGVFLRKIVYVKGDPADSEE